MALLLFLLVRRLKNHLYSCIEYTLHILYKPKWGEMSTINNKRVHNIKVPIRNLRKPTNQFSVRSTSLKHKMVCMISLLFSGSKIDVNVNSNSNSNGFPYALLNQHQYVMKWMHMAQLQLIFRGVIQNRGHKGFFLLAFAVFSVF